VSDGGHGFDAAAREQAWAARDGIGLYSMAERVRLLHGTFQTRSTPGEGASIIATFPMIQLVEARPDDA
jgi:two-component system sensor histidine kinase NreB